MGWTFELLDSEDRPLGALDGVTAGSCEIVAQSTLGGSASMSIDDRQTIDWMSNRVRVWWHGETRTVQHPEVGHWESGGDPVWVVDVPEHTVEHPEVGHWEEGDPVWVVDVPESTVEHPAEVVYRNDLDNPVTTGWTASLVAANGSGATGATATISGAAGARVLRVSTTGTSTSVNPTAAVRAVRAVPTVAGLDYTVSYRYKVVTGAVKGRLSFGTAQGPETTSNVLSPGTNIVLTAAGSSTDLVADAYDNTDITATRDSVYVEVGDITVTQSAWTETIPEQGHYEPGPDVWVVDTAAWTETVPEQGHWETSPMAWVVDQEAYTEVIEPVWAVGTYLFTSPTEQHTEFGVTTFNVGLLTKLNVLDGDRSDDRYTVAAGTPIIPTVVSLIQSTGETRIAATDSAVTLASAITWEAGTSKLTIINDLLQAAGYWSLWCDGGGQFRVEPYVDPANRTPVHTFEHGEASLHFPDWSREQDMTSVPNKIVLTTQGDDTTPALIGVATNDDPASPYSIPSRGRVISPQAETVEATSQDVIDALAARRLRDAMSPVSRITVTHAMLDLNPNEVVEFIPEDGSRRLASIQRMSMSFTFDTDIAAEWREVL